MPPSRSEDWPPFAEEHLRASGLTLADAEKLGLRWLSAEEAKVELRMRAIRSGGVCFPYYDLAGKAISGYVRVRVLSDPREGWDPRGVKYLQPAGSGVRVYYPPLVDWEAVQANGKAVLVTEGEKKATAACKAGLPTVGLGGVWSFGSKDLGIDLLPDLEALGWKERPVTIAFDSDWQENKDVRRAATTLARRLSERGAQVRFLSIPAGPRGEKVGVDDYLVAHGAKAFKELFHQAAPLDPGRAALEEYRRRFVLVRVNSCAWDRDTETLYSRGKLKDAFPDETVTLIGPTGRPRTMTKVEAWWEDPAKTAVDRQVLRPGEPEITKDGNLNLFRGWGMQAKDGETSVWEELLETVFLGNEGAKGWFERWLAYPLQHPGAKLHQCVFVFGGQGVGKTAIGEIMLDIYGPSGRVVQDRELFSDFNSWIATTLFALGDDLSFDEKRKSRSILKHLVTSTHHEINEKYVSSYSVENRCNFYLTANSPGSLPLDPSGINRRFLIVEAPSRRPKPLRWYTGVLDKWRKEGGAAAVHQRLLQLPLGGFHPRQDAPLTSAKHLVVETSRSPAEEWISTSLLEACPYQLAQARELYALFKSSGASSGVGIGAFTAALRAEAEPLGLHKMGPQSVTLWALRETEKWQQAGKPERIKQYRQERAME